MEWLVMPRWSPYAVGIGIGILSWITFMLSDRPIGCTTALARTSGMIERLFRGRKVYEKLYYKQFVPEIDWQWMLLVGVVGGAFISAQLSGAFALSWTPEVWVTAFGASPLVRWVVALIGGILMGLGARWAGGCTSGHGISGALQLATSSWAAAICFFIGGIAVAMFIFKIIGG